MNFVKTELKRRVDLRKYTTIKIGGSAEYFFLVHTIEELKDIVRSTGPDFYMLGKGSNLLVKDGRITKPVIKLAEEFSYVKEEKKYIVAGAGTPFSRLIKFCIERELGGLINLAGIPATVGGLLSMNSSSFDTDACSYLEEAEVMDQKGDIKIFTKNQIDFGYRFSSLKDYLILKAKFMLPEEKFLKQKAAGRLRARFDSQDFTLPNCGCVFKNPSGYTAGFLIDSCGLKGARKGGMRVSFKHANFIVNVGSAKYEDADYLINKNKEEVYKKYSIILEEEIKRWV